jgi:hypothetical protein
LARKVIIYGWCYLIEESFALSLDVRVGILVSLLTGSFFFLHQMRQL